MPHTASSAEEEEEEEEEEEGKEKESAEDREVEDEEGEELVVVVVEVCEEEAAAEEGALLPPKNAASTSSQPVLALALALALALELVVVAIVVVVVGEGEEEARSVAPLPNSEASTLSISAIESTLLMVRVPSSVVVVVVGGEVLSTLGVPSITTLRTSWSRFRSATRRRRAARATSSLSMCLLASCRMTASKARWCCWCSSNTDTTLSPPARIPPWSFPGATTGAVTWLTSKSTKPRRAPSRFRVMATSSS
jgi:hypothetical protein